MTYRGIVYTTPPPRLYIAYRHKNINTYLAPPHKKGNITATASSRLADATTTMTRGGRRTTTVCRGGGGGEGMEIIATSTAPPHARRAKTKTTSMRRKRTTSRGGGTMRRGTQGIMHDRPRRLRRRGIVTTMTIATTNAATTSTTIATATRTWATPVTTEVDDDGSGFGSGRWRRGPPKNLTKKEGMLLGIPR